MPCFSPAIFMMPYSMWYCINIGFPMLFWENVYQEMTKYNRRKNVRNSYC